MTWKILTLIIIKKSVTQFNLSSKIYNLISKLPKIDPKQVNPIYVKKISVEYD